MTGGVPGVVDAEFGDGAAGSACALCPAAVLQICCTLGNGRIVGLIWNVVAQILLLSALLLRAEHIQQQELFNARATEGCRVAI
jgi:hypothetical protein